MYKIFGIISLILSCIALFKLFVWIYNFLKIDEVPQKVKFDDEIKINFDENIHVFGQTNDRLAPLSDEELQRQVRLYGFVDSYEEKVRDVHSKITVNFNYKEKEFKLICNVAVDQIDIRMALYQESVLKIFVQELIDEIDSEKIEIHQKKNKYAFYLDLTSLSLGLARLT